MERVAEEADANDVWVVPCAGIAFWVEDEAAGSAGESAALLEEGSASEFRGKLVQSLQHLLRFGDNIQEF